MKRCSLTLFLVGALAVPLLFSCSETSCKHQHTHIEGNVEPTCTKFGETGYAVCDDCKEILVASKVIPALGHNYQNTNFIEPTPDCEGKTVGVICKRCGDVSVEPLPIPKTKIIINQENPLSIDGHTNATHTDKGYDLYGSRLISKSGYAFSFKHNGVLINTTPFVNISKIHIEADGDVNNLYLYIGDYPMPYLNPINVSNNKDIGNLEGKYFSLSYNGNSNVNIKEFDISYKYDNGSHVFEQTDLPTVTITTETNPDGSHKPISTKKEYVTSNVSIEHKTPEETDIHEMLAGVKLRGNSTLRAPKKAYRIKFDKKQSVLGLTKAKSWVLLAEYYDGSALHNYIVQKMVSHLDNFIFPFNMTHVNLILNGVNMGLYTLCEQPDEKEGRVGNEMDIELNTKLEDISFLVEHNERIGREPSSEDILNKTYIKFDTSDGWTRYYDISYPEIDSFPDYDKKKDSSVMFSNWLNYLRSLLKNAYEAVIANNSDEMKKYIDTNSLFQMCIIDDFVDECDHNWTSFKLHKDGNSKLIVGPCWDYDTVAFGFRAKSQPYEDPFKDHEPFSRHLRNPWLARSYQNPELKKDFYPIYKRYLVNNIETIKHELLNEAGNIAEELISNAKTWQGGNISIAFENIRYLNSYIEERYKTLMNGELKDIII